jgi:hypothetical protein
VGVGVAADVHEQRRVVHDDLVLVGQPELVREPQGDQALAEHVLHRLPEPEVDPEGQRGHELRQPDLARRVAGEVRARSAIHVGHLGPLSRDGFGALRITPWDGGRARAVGLDPHRAGAQATAQPLFAMFFSTTSTVRRSSAVGLNSMSSVPA